MCEPFLFIEKTRTLGSKPLFSKIPRTENLGKELKKGDVGTDSRSPKGKGGGTLS